MRNRLLLADDHGLMLEGLARLLAVDFDIVGKVMDGRQLVIQAEVLKPDIIVLDVAMPELNGIEAAHQISKFLPRARMIFVTQQLDPLYVRAAFRAGARGYVAKQSASSELIAAIHLTMQDRYYVTSLAVPKDSERLKNLDSRINPADMFGGDLTTRQREVLQLIAEGKSTKEISTSLRISPKTVEFHKNSLMDELGIRTTAELTRYALLHGIIST